MTTYQALFHESADSYLTLKEFTVPPSIPLGSALIKPLYSNLASYARATSDGKYVRPISFPFVPGHSCVGRIEAVGADATNLKAGDLVWVDSLVSARDDPDAQFLIGFYSGTAPELMAKAWPHGCFGEKLVLPIENCFVLPPSLFLSKAEGGLGYQVKDIAALSFILVCFAGLLDADVGPGKTVIVAPATGKFSGGAVLGALALGAKVVAASRNEERLSTLYSLPYANERLSTVKMTGEVKNDTAALLKAVGGDGKGAHVYMDVTPPLPSPGTPPHFKAALGALRRNAQLILEGGLMADISFNYFSAMTRNLTIKGKFMYERGEVEQCIRTIENGNLIIGEKAGLTIKGVFGLKEVDKALEMEGTSEWWGGDVLLAPNAEV